MTLEPYMEQIVSSYYDNGARKLHKMVDRILHKLHFVDIHKEDFYSLANEIFVIEVIPNYDPNRSFDGFLYSTLYKKFCTKMTRDTRYKRCTKIKVEEQDVYGNSIIREIIIPDGQLNEPIGDDENSTLEDIIPSKKTVESEIFGGKEEGYSYKMLAYLERLSNLQKEILRLTIAGYNAEEIRQELHISEAEYADCNAAIHSYKNVSVLF